MFQLADRWKEEDAEIVFADDRVDSDDEDPDFAPYTPRIDLEDVQAARASKDSPFDPIRDWSDDDDCYILEPAVAKSLAYALSTGGPAGTLARTGIRQNAPPAAGRKGKKAAVKAKKGGPPVMSVRSSGPRVMSTESG